MLEPDKRERRERREGKGKKKKTKERVKGNGGRRKGGREEKKERGTIYLASFTYLGSLTPSARASLSFVPKYLCLSRTVTRTPGIQSVASGKSDDSSNLKN